MNFFLKLILIMLGILMLLGIIYLFFVFKLKGINKRFFRYHQEIIEKEKNVLLIYQPSRHQTIMKIVKRIKEIILEKEYGIKIATLSKKDENYNSYTYVILVLPVYFGEVHEFTKEILNNCNKTNVIIVYNGLNKDSNHEDQEIKKVVKKKYSMIKVNTENIDNVDNFIKREVK